MIPNAGSSIDDSVAHLEEIVLKCRMPTEGVTSELPEERVHELILLVKNAVDEFIAERMGLESKYVEEANKAARAAQAEALATMQKNIAERRLLETRSELVTANATLQNITMRYGIIDDGESGAKALSASTQELKTEIEDRDAMISLLVDGIERLYIPAKRALQDLEAKEFVIQQLKERLTHEGDSVRYSLDRSVIQESAWQAKTSALEKQLAEANRSISLLQSRLRAQSEYHNREIAGLEKKFAAWQREDSAS